MDECLVGTDNCFGCGISAHKVRDRTMLKDREKESNQVQESDPTLDAPKKNKFMLSALGMIKRILLISLLVCCKYFQLMFMHC